MEGWEQGAWFDPGHDDTPETPRETQSPESPDALPTAEVASERTPERAQWQRPQEDRFFLDGETAPQAVPPPSPPPAPPIPVAQWADEPWSPPRRAEVVPPGAAPSAPVEEQGFFSLAGSPGASGPRRVPVTTRRLAELRRSNPAFREGGAGGDPYAAPVGGALAMGAVGATMAGGVLQTFSGDALESDEEKKKKRRQTWRTRAIAAGLALLVVLVVCSCGWLVFTPFLQSPGFVFNPGTRFATATVPAPTLTANATADGSGGSGGTGSGSGNGGGNGGGGAGTPIVPPPPGSTATPAPTPTPAPNSSTVAFLLAKQSVSSSPGMTACPSGCDLTGQNYANQQTFTVSNVKSTYTSQTKVTCPSSTPNCLLVTNKGNTSWHPSSYSFSGGGYTCEAQGVFVGPNSQSRFPCNVDITSPQSLPANTISGAVAGTQVSYATTTSLDTNAYWQVTDQDCANAFSNAQGTGTADQGTTWGKNWVSSQLPGGWQLATNPPSFSFSDVQCPQNATQQYFNASSMTHVNDAGFNPADARNVAASRLVAAVPSGYTLKAGSATSCNPSVTGWSIGNPINLQCGETGTAVYSWANSMSDQLAAAVAGKSKSDALAICNGTTGVQSGSCVITINGGDGATLPTSTSKIVIQANP